MTFAEKLDFVMNLTKTSNSALAHAVSLDASYISRLRTGKRLMPKDNRMIQGMAAFLARRFTEDYQKKALSDTLKLRNLPGDSSLLADEMTRWLLRDDADSTQQVGQFLSALSGMAGRSEQMHRPEDCQPHFPDASVSIYYASKASAGQRNTSFPRSPHRKHPGPFFCSAMKAPPG